MFQRKEIFMTLKTRYEISPNKPLIKRLKKKTAVTYLAPLKVNYKYKYRIYGFFSFLAPSDISIVIGGILLRRGVIWAFKYGLTEKKVECQDDIITLADTSTKIKNFKIIASGIKNHPKVVLSAFIYLLLWRMYFSLLRDIRLGETRGLSEYISSLYVIIPVKIIFLTLGVISNRILWIIIITSYGHYFHLILLHFNPYFYFCENVYKRYFGLFDLLISRNGSIFGDQNKAAPLLYLIAKLYVNRWLLTVFFFSAIFLELLLFHGHLHYGLLAFRVPGLGISHSTSTPLGLPKYMQGFKDYLERIRLTSEFFICKGVGWFSTSCVCSAPSVKLHSLVPYLIKGNPYAILAYLNHLLLISFCAVNDKNLLKHILIINGH